MLPIFDELVYAEKLLTKGFIKFMSYKDLLILAKFYFFKNLNEEQVRKKINSFCYTYNPEYNEVIFGNTVDKAIKNGKKTNLWIPKNIVITKNEISRIKEIKNYRLEKILFSLLVCAKYKKQEYDGGTKKGDDCMTTRYFVNTALSPILSLSKVYANRKEQESIRTTLHKQGYTIPLRKNIKGGFELLYVDNDSNNNNIFAEISSRDNILDFYPPYLMCLGCGKEIDKSSNSKKYCADCWKEKRKEDKLLYNR